MPQVIPAAPSTINETSGGKHAEPAWPGRYPGVGARYCRPKLRHWCASEFVRDRAVGKSIALYSFCMTCRL